METSRKKERNKYFKIEISIFKIDKQVTNILKIKQIF